MNPIPADYAPAPDLLAGRAILVTGAGQGLGRAVALECARHGATVALLGRRQDKLERVYDEIVAAGGAQPAIAPLDLATAGANEFDQLAGMLRHEFERLAGLVHCASHFVPLAPLDNQSLDQWTTLLRVNLAAPFALTKACLPLLQRAEGSAVVFTGETHGVRPAAYWGGFAVSKAALSTLAAVWADELERAGRPRMHVLVPGPTATPQRARSHPGELPAALPSAQSVARAYLYLLGPDCRVAAGSTVCL